MPIRNPKPTPPGVALEGTAVRKRGRPKKDVPFQSMTRILPTVGQTLEEKGEEGVDCGLAARRTALQATIVIERGFADEETPIGKKVEWALKTPAFILMLKEHFAPKQDQPKYPATEAAIDHELTKRMKAIAALDKGLKSPDPTIVDKVLDTFQPVQMEAPE